MIAYVHVRQSKLPFHVVFVSAEDPQSPGSELNAHGSSVRVSTRVVLAVRGVLSLLE
jgi:hypothetical protein